MAAPNIALNIPERYKKKIHSHFGCMVVPFYKCDEVAPEGAPVKLKDGDGETVELVTPGSAGANVVFGLLAQEVYDPSALGVLSGYEFHNNTRARKGDTIGVITGQGYVVTSNYTGTVAVRDSLYPGPSGTMVATAVGSDVAIGVAEEAGIDGDTPIRVRVNFNIA